jgi:hypothetical protein
LLAQITSEDIAEMIAFSRLEPWGALQEDFRAGQIVAAIWNVARDPKRGEPLKPEDFMPALRREMSGRSDAANEPILLKDPKAQSDLIRARIFGIGTDKAKQHGR